jgi:putative protein-disulfide isomerase
MNERQIIYFSDPMCSWCWGVSPVIEAVEAAWGERLPIRLIMGGLRPGTREAMSDGARQSLRGHWREVTQASGQPFGERALATPGFIYDTDPAARAVVIVRRKAPGEALRFLHRVQRAFYVDGEDVTDTGVLGVHAAASGLDGDEFAAQMASEAARSETWGDYALSRNAGVSGFPTLILGPRVDGTYVALTRGFAPAETVLANIDTALAQLG